MISQRVVSDGPAVMALASCWQPHLGMLGAQSTPHFIQYSRQPRYPASHSGRGRTADPGSVGTLGGRVFIGSSTALTHAHLERVLNVSFISRSSLGSESLLPYGRVFFFLCFSKPKQIRGVGGGKYLTEDLSVQCV